MELNVLILDLLNKDSFMFIYLSKSLFNKISVASLILKPGKEGNLIPSTCCI